HSCILISITPFSAAIARLCPGRSHSGNDADGGSVSMMNAPGREVSLRIVWLRIALRKFGLSEVWTRVPNVFIMMVLNA
ncbi:hypothetical protein LX36DRAFT_719341, partial [Colletotrichum falcatum]